jgi:hypothetical protein
MHWRVVEIQQLHHSSQGVSMGHAGTTRPQLLYVGNEALLSKATAELLKRAGYRVRTTSPVNADQILRNDRFGVVVLCATLSSDEADRVVETTLGAQPETPIVSVHLGLLGDSPNPRSTVVVDALNGPDALVNAVDAVTRTCNRLTSHAS